MSALPEPRDPRMDLVAEIKSDRVREQIAAALPEGHSIERFERLTATAILTNPELGRADRLSLLQALVKCAGMGCVPDGRQAALIVDKTGKVQVRDMVGYWRDLLARHGWALRANAVRANDEWDWTDEPQMIRHRKAVDERGELTFAYAIAVRRDGSREQAVLNRKQVEQRQAVAQTDAMWKKWPDEMWAKTAARYLAKRMGLAPVAVEDALEPGEERQVLYGVTRADLRRDTHRPAIEGSPEVTLSPADDDRQAGATNPPVTQAPAAGSDEPAPDVDDDVQVKAAEASLYVVGSWSEHFGGKTLGQVYEGGGLNWMRWCVGLEKSKPKTALPPELLAAILAFWRFKEPGLFQEATAQQELGGAA